MAKKIVTLAVLLFLFFNFTRASLGETEGIVAVVNDEVITQKDINEFTSMMYLQYSGEYKDRKELEKEVQKWKKDAVERLIEDRLLVQEAKNKKIVIEPQLVDRRIEEMKTQFATSEDFEKTILSEGLNLNDLKRKINEQLLMRQIVEQEVKEKIFVSPTEITAFYEGHKNEIMEFEKADADSIFIPFGDSEGNAQKKADEALSEIKKGISFSEVARKYSYSPSIGMIGRGQLKKEIEDVIFKLKKGEYSSIVKTEQGFYIFKLKDILPPKQLSMNEAQGQIQRIVFAEKFERKFSEWLDSLKSNAYVNVK
ncbi:MAG: SurA N-terminal domain-containing protein [Candidatus Omnitrophota bacterium]|nr:SurA N-terminal domain-containing protein [Candidatus Omnitrophota bacterium]